jgi:diguanylate cyclase (GGDEF)-like protein/PAS domain S-box-containing protein
VESRTRNALAEVGPNSERLVHLALGQNRILEQIALGVPLGETLDTLLRFLEQDTPEMWCSILLLDVDGVHLRHAAAPSLPSEYSRAIDGAAIGPKAGSCGTAAYRQQPVIVSDIETDPLWEGYRELVRPHGLRACWSTPILNAQGQVLGTFAMYFRKVASPEPLHRRLIDIALHVAAIAIGKERREIELRKLTSALAERVKELSVRRQVAQELLVDRPIGQELFDSLVRILPSGWQYPDLCQARIAYGPWEAKTPAFSDSPYKLEQTFSTSQNIGTITITYAEDVSARSQRHPTVDFFLPEERQLMLSLAETITIYLNRAHAEAALEESEERYRLLNLATNDAVWDWDLRKDSLWWNDGVEVLFGYPKQDVPAELSWWTERVHPEDRARVDGSLHAAALEPTRSTWVEEYRFQRRDGTYAHIQDRGYVMRNSKGTATRMIGMMEDITERKQAEAKIRELAYREPVTHLPNRAALKQHIAESVGDVDRRSQQLALILLNLNCFRDVNDCLGHQNGDAFLHGVAGRLSAIVGSYGHVASLGGDEFGILLPLVEGKAEVEAAVHQIHEALEAPILIGDIPIQVDATLGIALYPEHAMTGDMLWQHADIALRTAKERSETHLFYSTSIDHYDPTRLILLGELRSAIEGGQLVLHYQPKIDLQTGSTIGVEALVRWQHPTRGLLFPDTFIQLAERSGLINPLTTAVVSAALEQGVSFMRDGLELEMAVNLSARNLHEPDFARRMLAFVGKIGFPLSNLTLEITETAIMADPVRAKAVLTELHRAGIHISMDDFGIGQSSLSYLKELPITKMKIDKSFVMDFTRPRNVAVVRSAIDLARNMGLQATTEGVESEATYLGLRDLGCEIGQGYFFSKPQAVLGLERWLHESPWGLRAETNRPAAASA